MRWKITVDGDRCLGSGLCAATAPQHFRLAGARSVPVVELTEPDETVTEAAQLCPVEAVTIRDAGTGELLAPAG